MCDVLPSAVVTCLDPRHVPQSLPEGFEYAVSGISISARGASVFWDLPPSPAWQTACGIALCPSVWVSGVIWALMPQSPERTLPTQHVFCFFKYSKRYWFFILPDRITNRISFYDIFKEITKYNSKLVSGEDRHGVQVVHKLVPEDKGLGQLRLDPAVPVSARQCSFPASARQAGRSSGSPGCQQPPDCASRNTLPPWGPTFRDTAKGYSMEAIVWSLHLWTQYLWLEAWSTLGASLVSSALPGQSSVSLIKKKAPWLALPPDP